VARRAWTFLGLKVFTFSYTAPFTDIKRHQSSLTAVKLLVFGYFPFVKAAFAQGFALVNITGFSGCGAFEGKNIGHML